MNSIVVDLYNAYYVLKFSSMSGFIHKYSSSTHSTSYTHTSDEQLLVLALEFSQTGDNLTGTS